MDGSLLMVLTCCPRHCTAPGITIFTLSTLISLLQALGIDTRAHDVRFVEDNWESPVLGAWGLGWEVWLDGMEVTQFTYFQVNNAQLLTRSHR